MQSTNLARAQHRWFAEKAVASDSIDWDGLSKIIQSDQGKRELASLRNTILDLERAVGSVQGGAGGPDWSKYATQLDGSIVEKFEQAYKSMKIPKYEDKEIQQVAGRFKAIMEQAQKISAASKGRVAEIEKELGQIENEKKRLLTTTIDEELAHDPELAKKIDETNEKNSFLVN